jgi:cytochrome c oxidase subunit 3
MTGRVEPSPGIHEPVSLQHVAEHNAEAMNNLGIWLFLAGEVMFFGGLFTAYIVYRQAYPLVFAEASRHTDFLLGSINTAILLTSSLTMALAVNAIQTGSRKGLAAFLVITAMLGTAFLGIKGLEYVHKFQEGLFPGGNFSFPGAEPRPARLFFSLYFAMTGLHALHMIAGLLVMGVTAVRAWLGHFTLRRYSPVEMLALYWHFVDIIWIFLFPLLYLIDRT